jgi:hypothetical protein
MLTTLAEVNWNDMLGDKEAAGVVLLWIIVVLALLVVALTVQWRKAREARYNAALRQSMIERGFSADEIVRVLAAGNVHRRRRHPVPAQPAGKCCATPDT